MGQKISLIDQREWENSKRTRIPERERKMRIWETFGRDQKFVWKLIAKKSLKIKWIGKWALKENFGKFRIKKKNQWPWNLVVKFNERFKQRKRPWGNG